LFLGIELAAYDVMGEPLTLPLVGAVNGLCVAIAAAAIGLILFWFLSISLAMVWISLAAWAATFIGLAISSWRSFRQFTRSVSRQPAAPV
jgi:hypothetical protein